MTKFPTALGPGDLPPEVRAFHQAGALADNSRSAYWSDIQRFLDWGGNIPAEPKQVAGYLAAHSQSHKVSTLTRWIVAIGRAHTNQALVDPTRSPIVRVFLRGLRQQQGNNTRQVKALFAVDVIAMASACGTRLKDVRDKAILLIAFAGALRRSECVNLAIADVNEISQGLAICVHEQEGSTRPMRTVVVPFARGWICPVRAWRKWLEASGITSGMAFRGISRHGELSPRGLTPHGMALIIKERVQSIGLDPNLYSGHSLRSGWIETASREGIPSRIIRQHTGQGRLSVPESPDGTPPLMAEVPSIL
ncbi:MAG: tyrosine-type recombinase/integrase [Magnetococcales bacterium]|nr:tyrosine-type recombinase/integrase [Magnetococcales bacterium]MBF0157660.1 tyrosine-type recombinase/integrase [Magnetococcales bacterium]